MLLFNQQILEELVLKHANTLKPVQKWVNEVEAAKWSTFSDVKKTFKTADYVGNDRIVFNLKGNNYRIIAIAIFIEGVLYLRWAGTHGEYSKIKDCSII